MPGLRRFFATLYKNNVQITRKSALKFLSTTNNVYYINHYIRRINKEA